MYSNPGQKITTLFEGEEYGLLCCNTVYLGEVRRRFGGMHHLHLQSQRVSQARNQQQEGGNPVYFTVPQAIKRNLK
jgi:hypothetical protein